MKNHNRPKNASAKTPGRVSAGKTAAKAPSQHKEARVPQHANPGASLRLPSGDVLFGIHAVHAALANPDRDILALYVTENAADDLPSLHRGLRPTFVSRGQLDHAMQGAVHQGIVAVARPLPETDIEDAIRAVQNAGRGLIVLLDQVTDPHNVGAILRSSAVFGAAAVVVTERHAPQAMGVLAKSASGALERVPLVRVVNLARTLEQLAEADFWRIGLAEGDNMLGSTALAKLPPKVALVLGAEGPGLRRLTKERCDELLALPAAGDFTTLNVSNAAAVALYALTQR